MAAEITWKLISDDSPVTGTTGSPYHLTPYTLWRGMSVRQEYNYVYCENTGDAALTNPSHAYAQDGADSQWCIGAFNRKVTNKATGAVIINWISDGGGDGTNYYAYTFGPTSLGASMAVGTKYAMWNRHKIGISCPLMAFRMDHFIGGTP